MRYVVLFVATLALIIAGASFQPASLLPGSNLGFFESRIEGPMNVMMRNSPELKENFKEFERCKLSEDCDVKLIYAKRDKIVKAVWPKVYDQLEVESDWGTCIRCEIAHKDFNDARAKVGELRLRYECIPAARYTFHVGNDPGMEAGYTSVGYECAGKNITYPDTADSQ
jgi:hypothetical protein